MNALASIGQKGAGKTALLCQLIPVRVRRGHREETVTHVGPEGEPDTSGKDTFRHRAAGAERALLCSKSHAALFWDPEPAEAHIKRHLANLDLVVLEVCKASEYPKIEVHRHGAPLAGRIPVLAAISNRPMRVPNRTPLLSPDPKIVADFLEPEILGA